MRRTRETTSPGASTRSVRARHEREVHEPLPREEAFRIVRRNYAQFLDGMNTDRSQFFVKTMRSWVKRKTHLAPRGLSYEEREKLVPAIRVYQMAIHAEDKQTILRLIANGFDLNAVHMGKGGEPLHPIMPLLELRLPCRFRSKPFLALTAIEIFDLLVEHGMDLDKKIFPDDLRTVKQYMAECLLPLVNEICLHDGWRRGARAYFILAMAEKINI